MTCGAGVERSKFGSNSYLLYDSYLLYERCAIHTETTGPGRTGRAEMTWS